MELTTFGRPRFQDWKESFTPPGRLQWAFARLTFTVRRANEGDNLGTTTGICTESAPCLLSAPQERTRTPPPRCLRSS